MFPHGGQECSPVSSGGRWNGPQRLGVRKIAKGRSPSSSITLHSGLLSPAQIHTSALLYERLYGLLSPVRQLQEGSENAPEEISSRQLSFMMRLTRRCYREEMDSCGSLFLPGTFLPLLVKYTRPFPFKVIGSIKPGDLGQS